MRTPARAPEDTLRPAGMSTWLHSPAAIAAMAHCTAAIPLAPPIGVSAEKRRSGRPKLVTKASAGAPVMPIRMTPSMSLGSSPASSIAASEASICSSKALFGEARL